MEVEGRGSPCANPKLSASLKATSAPHRTAPQGCHKLEILTNCLLNIKFPPKKAPTNPSALCELQILKR